MPSPAAIVTVHLSEASAQFATYRKAAETTLRSLARKLVVWPWVEAVRGVGPLTLAQIVGEAGDLHAYPTHSALWQRMGLGLVDGAIQRRTRDAEKALAMGYSPRRRALMHVVGECLLRAGNEEFRGLYLRRKALETEKLQAEKPGHPHRRAMRYMEKVFLRRLWMEWRRSAIEAAA